MRFASESVCVVIAGALLGAPASLNAVVAAKQSRVMIVHVEESSEDVLKTFEASAVAAGLVCQHSTAYAGRSAFHCAPPPTGRNEGGVTVVDVKEKKAVVVSAYARNVATPHGELDPAIDATLRRFKAALAENPQVLRVDYCWAPRMESCRLSD